MSDLRPDDPAPENGGHLWHADSLASPPGFGFACERCPLVLVPSLDLVGFVPRVRLLLAGTTTAYFPREHRCTG